MKNTIILLGLLSISLCYGQNNEYKNPDGVPSISITPYSIFGKINYGSSNNKMRSNLNWNVQFKIPLSYSMTFSAFYNYEDYGYNFGNFVFPNDTKFKVSRIGGTFTFYFHGL